MTLSPGQFDRYRMTRRTVWEYGSRYPENTAYTLWANAPAHKVAEHLGERRDDIYTKAGEAYVAHKEGGSVYYNPEAGTAFNNHDFWAGRGGVPSGDEWRHAEASAKAQYEGSTFPGAQGRLFGDRHKPDHHMLQFLQTTREDRHMAPTMLGVAQNDHWQRTGQMIDPSDDLSRHSERFVEKLKGAGTGAVPETFERTSRNSMDFKSPQDRTLYVNSPSEVVQAQDLQYIGEIPKGEMESGRRTARSFLPKRPKAQPSVMQPSLFDESPTHD